MWLKNSSDRPDAVLTLLTMFTLAMVGRYLLGGLTLPYLGMVPAFDSGPAMAVLVPLLGTYLARRNGFGNKLAASAITPTAVGGSE